MSEGNGFAGRTALLNRCKRRYVTVEVDGEKWRIQSLSEKEQADWQARTLAQNGRVAKDKIAEARVRLLVLCLVDGAGVPLFTENDVAELRSLDSQIIGDLCEAALIHIGLAKGEIEGLVKNSERVLVESSPTA